jgi:hypothetical protein
MGGRIMKAGGGVAEAAAKVKKTRFKKRWRCLVLEE